MKSDRELIIKVITKISNLQRANDWTGLGNLLTLIDVKKLSTLERIAYCRSSYVTSPKYKNEFNNFVSRCRKIDGDKSYRGLF
jgi:hypothetical protein